METKRKLSSNTHIKNKTDFKTKSIIKDKGHYIMIKRTTQEE